MGKMRVIVFCALAVSSVLFLRCKNANFEKMVEEANQNKKTETLDPDKVISFKDDVWPIMQANCGLNNDQCHSSPSAWSGFQWVGYETVKEKQDDNGRYFKAINWENSDPNKRMPQGKPKLDQPSLDLIKKWIDAGLPNN